MTIAWPWYPFGNGGARVVRDLPLRESAWMTLVVGAASAIRPGGSLRLQADDRVLLLADPDDLKALAQLFVHPRR
jgi:NhaP-type Na+/H+ and K+/H+ antiporter